MIRNELKRSSNLYSNEVANALSKYYNNFLKKKPYYEYIRHHYAQRIAHLITNVKKNMKILDVGCGYGTETILCGVLNSKVIGIDISKERIEVAKKRLNFFNNIFNKNINVKYFLSNIFQHYGEYDIIWVNEAIHHIFPLNKFLKLSYQNLKIGGKLIIVDQNRLNPYTYILSKRAQKEHGGIILSKKEPETENTIHYAVERIFTIMEIKKILSHFFNIVEVYPFSYFPFFIYRFFNKHIMKIEENFIKKIPIIRLFSVGYTAICIK